MRYLLVSLQQTCTVLLAIAAYARTCFINTYGVKRHLEKSFLRTTKLSLANRFGRARRPYVL